MKLKVGTVFGNGILKKLLKSQLKVWLFVMGLIK
jgi:hypothetical protein